MTSTIFKMSCCKMVVEIKLLSRVSFGNERWFHFLKLRESHELPHQSWRRPPFVSAPLGSRGAICCGAGRSLPAASAAADVALIKGIIN